MSNPPNEYLPLIDVLKSIKPISTDLQSNLPKYFESRKIKKKRFLLEEGQVCDGMWFLLEGTVRSYIERAGGEKEITTNLMIGNCVVTSPKSFYTNSPSEENIELLSDCKILKITKGNLKQLPKDYPEFYDILLSLNGIHFCEVAKRETMLRLKTSAEKFDHFMTHFSYLLSEFSNEYIASFIGIDISTFNKIRNGKYKKPCQIKGGGKIYKTL